MSIDKQESSNQQINFLLDSLQHLSSFNEASGLKKIEDDPFQKNHEISSIKTNIPPHKEEQKIIIDEKRLILPIKNSNFLMKQKLILPIKNSNLLMKQKLILPIKNSNLLMKQRLILPIKNSNLLIKKKFK
jgi:hypothetical protein